jgi:F-type H+-transporting ATPase subunit b
MGFDLTTFCFEILNFLVLIWLLQRFLYKPVLKVITERQESMEKQVADATCKLEEAERLKSQYENRLTQWDKEKTELMSSLRVELQAEREQQLSKVRQEVENERKKAQGLIDMQMQEEERRCEQSALDLAAQFAAKVLSQLTSPELERSICKLFLADLRATAPDTAARVAADIGQKGNIISVSTAFPLDSDLRAKLETTLHEAMGVQGSYEYAEAPALLAGIKVTAGGTVLEASLKDAAMFFQAIGSNGNRK